MSLLDLSTSNFTYPVPFKVIPKWEAGVKIFTYVLVIIAALIGNVVIILIVWRNKRMRTTTNYYIVNLAVSDLMVTCSCTWVQLVDNLTNGWVLGAFFCKFNSFAQVCSLVSSVMTLCLIACDRFFGIVFAMKAHMTERRASTLIGVTWMIAIAVSLPFVFARELQERPWANYVERWCADTFPHYVTTHVAPNNMTYSTSFSPSKVGYLTFISVVLFFIPIVVMSIAYAMIIWRLWSNRLPGEQVESEISVQDRLKKKVVMMLMVLLFVFALCWMPLQISVLYDTHKPTHIKLPNWYDDFEYFAKFMAYSNSALNPIIYAGFNENFKRGFKSLLRCKRFEKKYNAISLRRDSSYRSSTVVTKI